MVHDRLLFFILGYFLPFYPANTQKKNHLEISLFYTSVPNIMIICYTVPEIWLMTDVIVMFHFGLFFALLLLTAHTKNENLKKMKKAAGDIIILHKCTKNHDHMLYCSWDMACERYNYFLFWAIFCPFTPLTSQKMKILK